MLEKEAPIFLIHQKEYTGTYPPFYPSTDSEAIKNIERNWETIRDELNANGGFKTMNAPHIKGEQGWKVIYLLHHGWLKPAVANAFPQTMALLYRIPNLTFAAFSMLEPGASLAPHYGDTNTTVRHHLGIEVPAPAPICALQVKEEIKGWETGRILHFNECHLHSAWNHSDQRRIVFAFDTLRPNLAPKRTFILARILAAETLSFFKNSFGLFKSLPNILHLLFYWLFAGCWFLYLPLQKGWKNLKTT
jgi:aspartyl/asparaginyl beta-hydroxylase (cupin superfamily)